MKAGIRKENIHGMATVLCQYLRSALQLARHREAKNEIRTIRKRMKRQGKDPGEEAHRLFWVGGRVISDDSESRARRDSGGAKLGGSLYNQ